MLHAVHAHLYTRKVVGRSLHASVALARSFLNVDHALVSMLLAARCGCDPDEIEARHRRAGVVRAKPSADNHHAWVSVLLAVCSFRVALVIVACLFRADVMRATHHYGRRNRSVEMPAAEKARRNGVHKHTAKRGLILDVTHIPLLSYSEKHDIVQAFPHASSPTMAFAPSAIAYTNYWETVTTCVHRQVHFQVRF